MRWIVMLMTACMLFLWTTDSRAHETHRVKTGETLYGIAKVHGTTVKALKKSNGLSGNLIRPGKVLRIPARRVAVPKPGNESALVVMTPPMQTEGTGEAEAVAEAGTNDPSGLEDPAGETSEPAFDDESLVYFSESAEKEAVKTEEAPNSLLAAAYEFLGIPYRFGGESKKGIDCSAFVQQVFRSFNIDLPRTAREQFKAGVKVSREELRVGDLFFFHTYARYPSHVGIYMGDGKMIHASSRYRKVSISSVDEPYYRKRLVGIVRVADAAPVF